VEIEFARSPFSSNNSAGFAAPALLSALGFGSKLALRFLFGFLPLTFPASALSFALLGPFWNPASSKARKHWACKGMR